MLGERTEKAIQALITRFYGSNPIKQIVQLPNGVDVEITTSGFGNVAFNFYEREGYTESDGKKTEIALNTKFSLKAIIEKRYPRRKTNKGKYWKKGEVSGG